VKHYIEPNGRFEKAFRQMPATHVWPFRPVTFESEKSKGYSEKVMYRCTGCRTKVWGKGGIGLVCECGRAFVTGTDVANTGLEEKVFHILAKRYRRQWESGVQRV